MISEKVEDKMMNLTLKVGHSLDISLHRAFCDAIDFARIEHAGLTIDGFIIDLDKTTIIRDSGWALLKMLNDCIASSGMHVILDNCSHELIQRFKGDQFGSHFYVYEKRGKSHS